MDYFEFRLFNFSIDRTDNFFHLSLCSFETEDWERCLLKIENDLGLWRIGFCFLNFMIDRRM